MKTVTYLGGLGEVYATAAFELKVGETSPPIPDAEADRILADFGEKCFSVADVEATESRAVDEPPADRAVDAPSKKRGGKSR